MKRFSFSLAAVAACLLCFNSCFPENSSPLEDANGDGIKDSEQQEQVETDWSDPAWYQTNFWERTDREKAGLRGPVKKWHITKYTTYDEYEYDEAGRLVKKSYVNTENSGSNNEWIYTYDSKGRLVKEEYFDTFSEGSSQDYTEYEYENGDKFVAREWFMMGPGISGFENSIVKGLSRSVRVVKDAFSSSHSETTYTFDDAGNLVIKETSYSLEIGSEDKSNETSYDYTVVYEGGYPKSLSTDKLRFQVLNISYYSNGMYKDFQYKEENAYNYDTGWDVHTYKMLDNPRYMAVETFDLGGTASYMSLTPKWMRKYYDEHYDIVRNEESYGTEEYSDTWTDYTYDKYGNWVSRVETVVPRYTGEAYPSTIERAIEYFD